MKQTNKQKQNIVKLEKAVKDELKNIFLRSFVIIAGYDDISESYYLEMQDTLSIHSAFIKTVETFGFKLSWVTHEGEWNKIHFRMDKNIGVLL